MAYTKRIDILKNCPTKVVNYNLITKKEVEKIRNTILDCLVKYNLENSDDFIIEYVEISKRLKTSAGYCGWIRGNNKVFYIKLAYNNYLEFGVESMIKTLRHEMAHLIETVLYGKSGHSDRFKKICVELGGHMNSHLAGKKYSDASTKDYCKSTRKVKYSYEYRCECGMSFKRKRKISNLNTLYARCKTCRTLVMNMKEVVI